MKISHIVVTGLLFCASSCLAMQPTNTEVDQEVYNTWLVECNKLPLFRSLKSLRFQRPAFNFDLIKEAVSDYFRSLDRVNSLTNEKHWVINPELNRDFLSLDNETFTPYGQKLIVPPYAEVSFHGDLHGDIHSLKTFIQDLNNKGYLEGFKIIKDNFCMIFLGDYVDKGIYGIEVIYTLLRLKAQNPEKVHLVRGNHEDININNRDLFLKEFAKKYPEENAYNICNLYNTLPVVLYLGSGQESYSFLQCCHGGMEVGFLPSAEFFQKDATIYERITRLSRSKNLDQIKSIEKVELEILKDLFNSKKELKPSDIGFLWSDFIINPARNYLATFNPARGFCYSQKLTKAIINALNERAYPHKIVGVFRAHQHTFDINDPMMKLLINGEESLTSNANQEGTDTRGVAKHWRSPEDHSKNLWPNIVCTFNVSPDSNYGKTLEYDFESYGMLTTGPTFQEWHLSMEQILRDFENNEN